MAHNPLPSQATHAHGHAHASGPCARHAHAPSQASGHGAHRVGHGFTLSPLTVCGWLP